MARPPTISTADILKAARALFLERGPDVPTAEIARRAGVSEGSIFRRFATKQELFLAALGLEEPQWAKKLCERAQQDDAKGGMVETALEILAFQQEILPRMMLLWSSDPSLMQKVHRGPSSPARQAVAALTEYFDKLMRVGKIRMGHPEIVARALMGSLHNYTFFKTMGIDTRESLDQTTYVRSLIDTLWQGIAPEHGS